MIPLIGMAMIFGLLAFALHKGIDGVALAIGLTIIGGLAGYKAKDLKNTFLRWFK